MIPQQDARELIRLWRGTRQTYARGPVILAHVMDLGSKMADALEALSEVKCDAKKDEIAKRYAFKLMEELPEHATDEAYADVEALFKQALTSYAALRETSGQRCGMCGGSGVAKPISEDELREAREATESIQRMLDGLIQKADH